jgi:ribonuclease-3
LFDEAFTHRSMACGVSYERLEFLGDSIASCILTGYIFRRFVKEDEGFLSRLRSHLISGKIYAEVSRQIGLPGWLRLLADQESLRLRPSAQEDVFEAFIGAMYLTYGYPITEMWTIGVFEEHIDISAVVRSTLNPRERLTNHCLAMFHKKPSIDIVRSDDGSVHAKVLHPETAAVVAEAHSDTHNKAIADACDIASAALFASHATVADFV